jgi:hypothetical protein
MIKQEMYHLIAHCNHHFNRQFTCLFRPVQDRKVFELYAGVRGEIKEAMTTSIPIPENLLKSIEIDTHFACPFCKSKSLYHCSHCQSYSCWNEESIYITCANPACKHEGKIKQG